MRNYGKVYTAFWTSEDVLSMPEDSRTLALYLLTCPHSNMLGCFRLTNAYASDDLHWDVKRVSKAFQDLCTKGFIYRCERSFWVVIRCYLKWNQFENPNVGKAAGKLFNTITPPSAVKALLAAALREFSPLFPASVLDKFETSLKPFQNTSKLNVETGTGTGTGTEIETETETGTEATSLVEHSPHASVKQIFEYWQKVMDSPKSVLDVNRAGLINKALQGYSAADICKAIRGCSKSPHNMGVNEQRTKYNGLDLILRNADKIDRFIALDAGTARPSSHSETIEETNARIMAEILGVTSVGHNTFIMEA